MPAAEKIRKAGIQTGFHSHETEFSMLDGLLIYGALMSRLILVLLKCNFKQK